VRPRDPRRGADGLQENLTDILIRELSRPERPALERHFLALGGDDRRLRFGTPLNDTALRAYVERIDFERDAAFGVVDDQLHLIGAAHVARSERSAELGVSVLPAHRGRGIGGDPVNGLKHVDVLKLFNDDPRTEAVVMVGEIGGTNEEEAARWVKANMRKPVVGFIAGVTAPPGKRMGHAGAIISGGTGTAAEKLEVMEACGIKVTRNPAEMGKLLKSVLR